MPCRDRALSSALVFLLLACTVDSQDGATSLGDPSYGTTVPTTTSPSTSTTVSTTTDETASSSSEAEAESGSGSATSSDPESSSEGSAGSTGGVDEQPANGVYAACESAVDCVGAVYCIAVMPNVGFCSKACSDPMVDCPASPGGTATPACVAAMPGQVCALDCSGGKTCPGGMECAALDAAMVCV